VKVPRRNRRKGFWEFLWKAITDPRIIAALISLAAAIVTALGRR
jgi:hypothetical protein